MKYLSLLLITTMLHVKINAQNTTFYDAARVVVQPATTLYVEGSVVVDTNSVVDNSGEVMLTGDWINNSGGNALANNSPGTVTMAGAYQEIGGAFVTTFYNLHLQGAGATKSAMIDADVSNALDLEDAVLATNDYLVHLTNPSPTALSWNNGYINTLNLGGYFLRSTNSTSTYAFPVGSANRLGTYRAVEVAPTTADPSVFGARFADLDPDLDGGTSASGGVAPFVSQSKAPDVAEITEQFYHNVYRFSGSADANLNFYFFNSDPDALVTSVAQWKQGTDQWEDQHFAIVDVTNALPQYGMPNKMATKTISDFQHDAFALIELELKVPTGFSPGNDDGVNDVFEIAGLEEFPNNELIIFNRWGDVVYQAAPYMNDWRGYNNVNGLKLMGDELPEGTYFYILKLDETIPNLTGYLELKRD